MGAMTTRERLHELVDQLDEAAAERLLSAATSITPAGHDGSAAMPAFVGAFAGERSDTSTRAKQILREELGNPARP